MKNKIDTTNWKEVIDYMVSQSKFEWKTEEYFIKDLQKDMIDEIIWLWSEAELNTSNFDLKNDFVKNANVDKEDYFLTGYDLIKKYGQDWYDENYQGSTISIKNNLSIDQLELLASLMKHGYYDFWNYEINEKGFIFPRFNQYSTSEYSEYVSDKTRFENFEVEINQQNSSKTQKLTM